MRFGLTVDRKFDIANPRRVNRHVIVLLAGLPPSVVGSAQVISLTSMARRAEL
jgi:hypothetical protein